MSTLTTDRIQKQVLLCVPPARVWQALADAQEFGSWFGAEMIGAFSPGAQAQGKITHPGYEHLTMEMTIERMEPERVFAWSWHPNAVESGRDYAAEPTTLVIFELEEVPEGTLLTVTESGFDGIPLERRAEAYRGNEGGWEAQMQAIARHVGQER